VKTTNKTELDRREFMKSGGAALAGVGVVRNLQPTTRPGDAGLFQRRIFRLNHNWLFSDKMLPNATRVDFDDRKLARVTIPHTNRMLPWNGFDDKSYQFVSIYRRHFKLPIELHSKRVFVDFGGVMTAADR